MRLLIPGLLLRQMYDLDSRLAEEVEAVGYTIKFRKHNASDAGLNDELGALHARRGRDIQRSSVAGVIAACHFGDGVSFGVEHVWICHAIFILADIVKARWSAVVTV